MKEIGGYFELELPQCEEYHKDAIRLNTGRNAFEYVLRAKGYKKVFLPYYTCDVMLEPIRKLSLDYAFYHIDRHFRPVFNFSGLGPDDVFVYTNYFGICDKQAAEVSGKCNKLILDNAQAFFSKPLPDVDTFYSPRKFFGLPDGAYLYTDNILNKQLSADISFERFGHLSGRIDVGAEKCYKLFKRNDDELSSQPIRSMSALTQRLLCGIDYETAMKQRRKNFQLLHNSLKSNNELSIEMQSFSVPMVYPYLIENGAELKKRLIDHKIYVATYWPNVAEWVERDSLEYHLLHNLVPIPVDQRYDESDMNYILETIGNH